MGVSDATPGDHRAQGGDVAEPVEGVVGTGLSASEVSEEGEGGADGESVDGNTGLVDLGEDAGSLASLGEHEQRTRARVQELVARRERRGEDNSVLTYRSVCGGWTEVRSLLMMCDRTLMPAVSMMITNGD